MLCCDVLLCCDVYTVNQLSSVSNCNYHKSISCSKFPPPSLSHTLSPTHTQTRTHPCPHTLFPSHQTRSDVVYYVFAAAGFDEGKWICLSVCLFICLFGFFTFISIFVIITVLFSQELNCQQLKLVSSF